MISKQLLDKASAVLPKCKMLSDAERHLGGEWHEHEMKRDYKAAAVSWGLFEGWHGRPMTDDFIDIKHTSLYKEAHEIGRKLSLSEVPE